MARAEMPVEDRSYVEDLVRRVAAHLQVNPAEVIAKNSKVGQLPLARQIIWHHLYLRESWTLQRIGKHFSGRDYSTVAHGLERMRDILDQTGAESRAVRELLASLPTQQQYVSGGLDGMTPAALMNQAADGLEQVAAAMRALAQRANGDASTVGARR